MHFREKRSSKQKVKALKTNETFLDDHFENKDEGWPTTQASESQEKSEDENSMDETGEISAECGDQMGAECRNMDDMGDKGAESCEEAKEYAGNRSAGQEQMDVWDGVGVDTESDEHPTKCAGDKCMEAEMNDVHA